MKKILILLLIIILLVLGYFIVFKDLDFGGNVLSIFDIKDENDNLDTALQTVSTLTSVDKPKAIQDLNNSAKELVRVKDEYNDKILYSSQEEILQATQGRQYEMEYLWTKIGNHATKNGIVLKMQVKQSATGVPGQYDLKFIATGKYVSISEFIASLENDSSLNFKIENTSLTPFEGSTENLQGTFDVKNISININSNTSTKVNPDSMTTTNSSSTPEGGNS